MPATGADNLQVRRGTAAGWTATNPLLLNSEPGYETDTNKLKFGDGVTLWNALPYFAPGGAGPGTAGLAGVGFPGTDGDDGLTIPGDRGAAGADGAAGPPGGAGVTVPWPGEDGDVALTVPGDRGPAGADGGAGTPGTAGTPGITVPWPGEDGDVALTVPGDRGPAGADGAAGGAGAAGVPGISVPWAGADGDDALMVPGEPGVKGADGVAGSAGAAGISVPWPGGDGDDGTFGVPGDKGGAGADGVGTVGATGPPGPLVYTVGEDGDPGMFIPGSKGDTGPSGGAGAGWSPLTQDLGAARRSGTFDITGLSGLTAGVDVSVVQTRAPIASKGNATDEFEMDPIVLSGRTLDTSTIRVLWGAPSTVVGTYEFSYLVGALGSAGGSSLDAKSTSYPVFTPGARDDEFNDSNFSGWTAVNSGAHNPTITETNDVASFLLPGSDAAAEFHAYMKAYTPAVGEYVEVCISSMAGRNQNYNIFAVLMANGATYGAGLQAALYFSPAETSWYTAQLSGYSGYGLLTAYSVPPRMGHDWFLRLKYVSANNFRAYVSPDGVSWVDISQADANLGVVPTHIGFGMTTWGGAQPCAWSIRYFKQG